MVLGEGRQHHGRNLLRRIVSVKGPPRIGGAHQPVVVLGGQQHELALAAPGDLDRPSERSLDDLAGSVAQVGQRKMRHRDLLRANLTIFMILAIMAIRQILVKVRRAKIRNGSHWGDVHLNVLILIGLDLDL
jgi:hypothetical protein